MKTAITTIGLALAVCALALGWPGRAVAEPERVLTGELVVLKGSANQFRIVGQPGAFSAPAGTDLTSLDGKNVQVDIGPGGRVSQIALRPVAIDPVTHGWSTVRGAFVVRDPVSGRFSFAGDTETYAAPAGVNISAYDGRMVEAKLDADGRVIELMPVGPAPGQAVQPLPAATSACSYGGQTYSAGAAVCQAGTQYRCDGLRWQSLGLACTTTAADAPPAAGRAPRSCAIGDATVAAGSGICREGMTYRCDDGAWIKTGTACQ